MKKIFFILLVALGLQAQAQDNFFGITYNTAITTGETQDFIDAYSWGIMGLEWKKMMNDNFAIGLNIAWQVMSQKIQNESIVVDNLTLSGTQLRYLNYFPVTLSGTYHFNPTGKIIPYVAGGAGLYRVLQRYDISGFVIDNNTWNFGFYPEVGFLLPTGGNSDLFVNTKYHYILPADGGMTHSYVNINIGFSYFY